jgi:hypothetical protein
MLEDEFKSGGIVSLATMPSDSSPQSREPILPFEALVALARRCQFGCYTSVETQVRNGLSNAHKASGFHFELRQSAPGCTIHVTRFEKREWCPDRV